VGVRFPTAPSPGLRGRRCPPSLGARAPRASRPLVPPMTTASGSSTGQGRRWGPGRPEMWPLPVDAAEPDPRLEARWRRTRARLRRCLRKEWAREAPGGARGTAAACLAWLAACGQPGSPLAVELYAGSGQLTAALAVGLARGGAGRGPSGRGHVLAFEGEDGSSPVALAPHPRVRLSAEPVPGLLERLRQALPRNLSGRGAAGGAGATVAMLQGPAYPPDLCPHDCGRPGRTYWQRTGMRNCFRCPAPIHGQSALRDLCEGFLGRAVRLDLALLDTGHPAMVEWFLLESHCRPRHVFLADGTLPLHQGWVADRLLRAPNSSWRELHAGLVPRTGEPWPDMLELLRPASFQLLSDMEDEPPLVCEDSVDRSEQRGT